MSKMYSEQDLHDLISKVETEFNQHLAKAEAEAKGLQKAEIEKCGEMSKADEVKPEEKQDQAAPAAEPQEQEPAAEHDYDADDMEGVKALYASMPAAELALHKAAILACESHDGGLEKSEEKQQEPAPAVESEELKLAKSEIDSLKKSNEEIKTQFEQLVKSLNQKLVRPAPKQKAITELGVLAKSEQPEQLPADRKEVVKILNKKILEGKLEKSDRDAVKLYVLGETKLETVSHLLK